MAKSVAKRKPAKKIESPALIVEPPASRFTTAIKNAIGKLAPHHEQIIEQRAPVTQTVQRAQERPKPKANNYIWTKIPGFDALMENGIPEGNAIIIAGGAGSGKTIFCLQALYEAAKLGKRCLYMSFEESTEKLMQHMRDFGWNPDPLIADGKLIIQRFNPFDITRGVDALLLRAKGELLIDIKPVLLPLDFKPDRVVVDSLTAIASAFAGKEDSYRIYIEQLFRFFEELGATSFLITETKQIPTIFSTTGVEEFLADGVVVLYNIKRGNIRENAIEILKLRGAKHQKKIVAMQITDRGIEVFPEQEVFGDVDAKDDRS
ncbi:MAG TPA: ATPase domain-containing protein [Candidatus Nanoarchaeia archaeon]|nr:ATPase domain-containing protein [Candidatus Nanoarchaeia archaeon]